MVQFSQEYIDAYVSVLVQSIGELSVKVATLSGNLAEAKSSIAKMSEEIETMKVTSAKNDPSPSSP